MVERTGFLATTVGLLMLYSVGCNRAHEDGKVVVSAAASLTDPFTALAAAYEQESGKTVSLNFAASSVCAQQIEKGFQADLFVSANAQWTDYLVQRGVTGGKAQRLMGNRLVAITPAASGLTATTAQQLSKQCQTIALGDPSHVPAGMYARQALEQAGVWPLLQGRVVGTLDVRAALALVQEAAADCAVVYATDVVNREEVRVLFEFPVHPKHEIAYWALVLSTGSALDSRHFLEFIVSPQGRKILADHGFAL